jgi:ribosomal protein L37AE/L43A
MRISIKAHSAGADSASLEIFVTRLWRNRVRRDAAANCLDLASTPTMIRSGWADREARMMQSSAGSAVPHNNPCAQCGQVIARPVWSEPLDREVHFVWVCEACDYEFTQIATYREEIAAEIDREMAA